jgi:hypothetical protein
VWECEKWRGAILAECCCIATAMGEWGQAGDESWEGGGEEGEAAWGRGMDVIVQLTGASRSDQSQLDFYTFVGFRSSLKPPHPTCCPSGQHFCTYKPCPHDSLSAAFQASCDPAATDVRTLPLYSTFVLVPDPYVINMFRSPLLALSYIHIHPFIPD